jgi:predicted transcriptional regulator
MSRNTTATSITLPRQQVEQLDQLAERERRSRSNLVSVALAEYFELRRRITGPSRLAELEQLSRDGMTKAARPPDTSAADALREHQRLCGYTPDDEETDGNAD